MRRFSDSILFAVLFLIDLFALVLVILFHGVEMGVPYRVAPLSIGGIVVVAAPVLFIAMLFALARVFTHTSPRHFYSWATLSSIVSAVVISVADIPTQALGIQVGFSWMIWFFGILALAFVIALIISFTGGIPNESTDGGEPKKSEMPEKPRRNSHEQARFTAPYESDRQQNEEQSASVSVVTPREDLPTNTSDNSVPRQPSKQQKEEDPFQ